VSIELINVKMGNRIVKCDYYSERRKKFHGLVILNENTNECLLLSELPPFKTYGELVNYLLRIFYNGESYKAIITVRRSKYFVVKPYDKLPKNIKFVEFISDTIGDIKFSFIR